MIALVGPNGAGKTNLLEAISLLTAGRGLRGAGFDQLGRMGGTGAWAIAAESQTIDGAFRLGTGWTAAQEDGEGNASTGRMVLIDGRMQKSSGVLGEYLRMLWLTPAMDRLFAGPPGDRRRFLDRLVASFDPEHGSRIAIFEKVMRERNLLLQESNPDRAWISSLESHMAEAAIAIAAARTAVVDQLAAHMAEHRASPEFPWGEVQISGEIENLVSAMPAVHAEDEYRRLLHDSRGGDRAAGRTLRGPHRSDLLVVHGPKAMPAESCSTGEQKALLIGLILAQARAVKETIGASPLLLLDEVAAHLDATRRAGLFANLRDLNAQCWMTGTDDYLFADLKGSSQHFHVDAGDLTEMRQNQ